jgi:hypothetical protein
MTRLLGAAEVAELLGLTRQGLRLRRAQPDFPEPIANLKATPVWDHDSLVEYARSRTAHYVERAAIEELAWGNPE